MPSRDGIEASRSGSDNRRIWDCSIPLFALLVCAPQSLAGQTIRGIVVESRTETPIAFARLALVQADGTVDASTTADGEGRFRLTASAGLYRLTSERLGYASVTDSIRLDAVGEVLVVVRMAAEAVPLDPIVVVGRSGLERGRDGFERRRSLGRGLFLTVDSIRAREPVVATDAFYSLPGVIVHDDLTPGGRRDPIFYTSSGAKCLLIYMDHIVTPLCTW
jgi:hypothetical protein